MKNLKSRLLFVLSFVFAGVIFSCSNVLSDSGRQYGSLKIVSGDRSVDVSSIEKADVFLAGREMSLQTKTGVSISKTGSGTVEFTEIPYGKNRVLKAQAKRTIGSVLSDMDGVTLYAVTDILQPENSVSLDWNSTAVGSVYWKLLEEGYDVSKVEQSTVKALIPAVHAALVNTSEIAADIAAGSVKSKDSYRLDAGTVKFTLDSSDSGITASVNDPVSQKLAGVSSSNTIENIAPGTWSFRLVKNGSILYEKAVVISGNECDLGKIVLKVPSPRLEDAEGKARGTNITGSEKVYLACRTMNGEEAFDAEIYYTLDGSVPSKSSTKYTSSGITVSSGVTLKAVGIKNGIEQSDVVSFSFAAISTKLGEMHPSSGPFSVVSNPSSGEPGALYNGSNVVFSVYSANAEKILLEIYDEAYGEDARYDYWLKKGSDNFWRIELKDVPNYTLYGFRVWGPNFTFSESWKRGGSAAGFVADYDSTGNRFNPNKVVFDPYARELSHDPSNPYALSENGNAHTNAELCSGVNYYKIDSGRFAPKGVVVKDSTSFGTKPKIPQKDAIIYEAHPRGITKHPSASSLESILSGLDGFENVVNVPSELRGTYAGAAYLAPYLKAIGVNTIELLPVHESDNDCNPENAPGGNYWAYMTFDYFAPDRRYSSDKSLGGPTKEFKQMVKAFHDEGIEVYLDVVYNHTGEGGPWNGDSSKATYDQRKQCEIVSMRGLDNKTWYSLVKADKSAYWETTGCGNNMQCDNAVVRKFIIDSLSYWITEMGVDGFRFDLAPVLGREYNSSTGNWEFNNKATTLVNIMSLGTANDVEMIAESWDCGGDGYSVGNFPAGWGGWNGRFRDSIRGFVGAGNRGSVNDYINGDYEYFNKEGGPHKSVNFVCAHDGFTLADLCSYSGAGNALNSTVKWPFGPSDGGNGDYNSIAGDEPAMKRQSARNFFALQMFSRGVPMIVWGDEFGRTQKGNNNAYNVDSVGTWSNYNMINTDSPHTVSTGGTGASYDNNFGTFANSSNVNGNFVFAKYIMKLRESDPALRQADYKVAYTFTGPSGAALTQKDNASMLKIGGSAVTGGHDYIVMANMTSGEVSFTFPAPKTGYYWTRIVDTGSWAESDFNVWDERDDSYNRSVSDSYGVGPKTVTILKQVPDGTANRVKKPEITIASGSVTITSATAGSTIYYTIDGTVPSRTNGKIYKSAFTVTSGTNVQAMAVKTGMLDSKVAGKTYLEGKDITLTTSSWWVWNGGCPMFAYCTTSSGIVWVECSGKAVAEGQTATISVTVPNGTTSLYCVRCPAGTTNPDNASEIYNTSKNVSIGSGSTYTITW